MVNMYKSRQDIFINDVFYPCFSKPLGTKISEAIPENTTYSITWDNLEAGPHIEKCDIPYIISKIFGKRKVIFKDYSESLLCPKVLKFREGKDDLKIEIRIRWNQVNPSLNQILKWPFGDQAIQYLKDRGLAICPNIKNGE